jgi:RNA polymerase sigma-70 factor, ECF subfamily
MALLLPGLLARITGSPVVEMNQAIALAEVEGPEAALGMLDRLPLADYRYFHSTRADLLRRLGRIDDAQRAYRQGLTLTPSAAERQFIERRLAEVQPAAPVEQDEFWTISLKELGARFDGETPT